MKNEKLHWKYQLYFSMIGAYDAGAKEHPQAEMKRFIEKMKVEGVNIEILESEPVSIADCWLFLVKCSSPWLGGSLPSYITHQGLGSDKEGKYS